MSTITGQWAPAITAIRLTMTLTHPLVSLERVDANGFHPVRTEGNWTPFGTTVLDDHEAALTGPISYLLTTTTETLEIAVAAAPELLPSIHAVTDPVQRYTAQSITTWAEQTDWATSISPIIDAEYPRAVLGPRQARALTLAVVCESYASAAALRSTLSGQTTYMARQQEHQGMDAYFTPLSARILPMVIAAEATTWAVEITAQELAWPTGSLRSLLGRSYGDDLNDAPTYRASMIARPTYANRQAMN